MAGEKQINKRDLMNLIKSKMGHQTEVRELNDNWKSRLEKAQNEQYLNKPAFDAVFKLSKMEPAKAAHTWRAMMFYVDMLGLADQGDIEDKVVEAGGDPGKIAAGGEALNKALEDGDDGKAAGGDKPASVKPVSDKAKKSILKTFEKGIAAAETVDQVNKGLANFVKDWPDLEQAAHDLVEARVAKMTPGKTKAEPAPALN